MTMQRMLISAAAGAFALLFATGASASDDPVRAEAVVAADSGPLDRSVSAASGAELTAGSDADNVKLKLSFGEFSLTASAPASDDGSDTELATLDGFADAVWLEAKFTHLYAPGLRDIRSGAADAICAELREVPGHEMDGCGVDSIRAVLGPAKADAYARATHIRTFFWGGSARVGYDQFEYFDPITLAKEEDERTPWGVSAFFAFTPLNDPLLVTFTGAYQEAWKDADTQVLCPGGVPPVVCVNGPIGGPVDDHRSLASIEVRRGFRVDGVPGFDRWAISAQVTYDFNSDVTGVDVPVYLFQAPPSDDDNGRRPGLTGGLRVGWRDDTDDISLGLFIGAAFSTSGR